MANPTTTRASSTTMIVALTIHVVGLLSSHFFARREFCELICCYLPVCRFGSASFFLPLPPIADRILLL